MDNEIPGTTLSTNKRLLFLSYYLEYSIRFGAYASNLFFGTIITPYLQRAAPNQFSKSIFVWAYGIILYEVIWRIINKRYNPKFKKRSEAVAQGLQNVPGLLVLDDPDYEYRVRIEKLVKQLGYYYAFQLLVSLILYGLGYVSGELETNLGWATFGGFFQIFNFFGVVLLIVNVSNRVSVAYFIFSSLMGLGFAAPLLVYIIYAFRTFY